MKFVDIHTHRSFAAENEIFVRNLSINEAETVLPKKLGGFYSVGIHPWDLKQKNETDFQKLEEFCHNKQVRLIGECGFNKNKDIPFEAQLSAFERHITISEKTKKPMIIHCVGYYNEVVSLRKQVNPTQQWIIHGFRGKPQLAKQLLQTGFSLSFGERYNPESVKACPLEHLFVETDESKKAISEIYAEITQIKKCSINEIRAGFNLLSC